MKPDVPLVGPLERTLYLQSLAMFEGLRSSQLARLAQLMREEYVAEGAVLYREGEPPSALYLLVDGSVANLRGGRIVYTQEGPATTGMSALLGGRVASLEVVAQTGLTTLVVDGNAFLDLIEDHFDVYLHFRSLYAKRVAVLQKETKVFHTVRAESGALDLLEPKGMVERLLSMRKSVVFADVSVNALAQMIHGNDDLRVDADTEIWREGEIGRFLVLIMRGEVECAVAREGGGFFAGPGYVLGADATFGGIPYAYSARSVTPVVALQIDAAVLTDIKEDHFDFALSTLAHFAREEVRLLECKANLAGGGL